KREQDKREILGVIHELRQEFLGYIHKIEDRQEKFQEEVRAEFRHINQRFDTVVNMLLSLSLSKRKEE
ncbi:MAG: hypothetical protein RMK35_05700, partial [Aquificaceae bacterium]|nr:hypothetical protein [Aquificaceae bacterium]